MTLQPESAYEFTLAALCVWREARGESAEGKRAVAWVIRNRALTPSWWGSGWSGVILKPFQFSSFNSSDPNAVKWPAKGDPAWMECLNAAAEVFEGEAQDDPTRGATHYYDDSIPKPEWTRAMIPVLKVGRLNFYKETLSNV